MSGTPAVRLREVSKAFSGPGGKAVCVLNNVNLSLASGEKASLLGPSGTGKSTLLALIAGLLEPDSGAVEFDGVPLHQLSETERSQLRASKVGIALQADNLVPFLTASENIELAIRLGSNTKGKEAQQRALELLDQFDVAQRANHRPRHLSGGEAQRVALAVALANDPEVLLADEVVAQLDTSTAGRVVDVILDAPLTLLFVTHDVALGDRVGRRLLLNDGKITRR